MKTSAEIAAILAVVVCASAARGAADLERQFLWAEANSAMAAARQPADFLRAARKYRGLAELGARNEYLFYNLGTALLLAGEHDAALRELTRAERYAGSTWEIRRNLAIAAAVRPEGSPPGWPWLRYMLFWHYMPAGWARMSIAVVAFFAIWVGLVMAAVGVVKYGRLLAALATVLFILFSSSAAVTAYQEWAENEAQDRFGAWRAPPLPNMRAQP